VNLTKKDRRVPKRGADRTPDRYKGENLGAMEAFSSIRRAVRAGFDPWLNRLTRLFRHRHTKILARVKKIGPTLWSTSSLQLSQ
jgi:hypothetical protein